LKLETKAFENQMELEKTKTYLKNWNYYMKKPLVFPHPYKVEGGQ